MIYLLFAIFFCLSFEYSTAATEQVVPILTVTGKITQYTNQKSKQYAFTRADLLAMKQSVIHTETVWTKSSKFSGPAIKDLLKKVGSYGTKLKVIALNNYSYIIEIEHINQYCPILALKMNDEFLKLSEFGPLFIVYPLSQFKKELSLPTERAKFVWQVYHISIE